MNIETVKARVAEMVAMKADDEQAHSEEDALHQDVLRAIADGRCDDPAACAREALKTTEIDFSRWCS